MKLRYRILLRALEWLVEHTGNPNQEESDEEVLRIARMSNTEFRAELARLEGE